jgi:hypothetical protein
MTTINQVIRKANEAGLKTYLKGIEEPMRLYGGEMTEREYIIAGGSWETPYRLKESELESEYNVFAKMVDSKK